MWIAAIAVFLHLKAEPSTGRTAVATQSSARCVAVTAAADERVAPPPEIAPGPPPLLSFRYYEGQLHHRYSNSDLMLDDAGH